jgi:Protein of unknown function (DUF2510)
MAMNNGAMPQPGWYVDPWNPAAHRWWDGAAWTSNIALAAGAGSASNQVASTESPADALSKERKSADFLTMAGLVHAVTATVTAVVIVSVFRSLFRDVQQQIDSIESGYRTQRFTVPPYFSLLGALNWLYTGARIWWTYRVCSNAKILGLRQQRDPGLTSASWILPIVNFWFPYVGIRDAVPPQRRISVLPWWWATTIIGQLMSLVLGAVLTAAFGWWIGGPVVFVLLLVHVWLERRVSQAVLAEHQTLFGL